MPAQRDGSYATQRDRERVLDLVANQLQELGYRHMAAASLTPKHVKGLVERLQAEGLTVPVKAGYASPCPCASHAIPKPCR